MLGSTKKKNRNIRGLQLVDEAVKPEITGTAESKPKIINKSHRSNPSGANSTSSDSTTPSSSSSPSVPSSAFSSSSSGGKAGDRLSRQLANLELGIEFKLDLRSEDLEPVGELGAGNGGTVSRVRHIPTGAIMAKKVVHIDAKPSVRKQIVRELQIMHDCNSKYIVSFYGAYLNDPQICMCMELMDKGSLDDIYKKNGPIKVDILGKIAVAVVSGLTYLYDVHRIIHRDVKPSNVLVNSAGQIKICDFGVSGELINSVADTFVGTSTYMSPERIQGAAYTVKSDVWSLGIMLVELALGRFPFSSEDESDDDFDDEPTLSPVRPRGKEQALMDADKRRSERRSAVINPGQLTATDVHTQSKKSKNDKPKKPKKSPGLGAGGMSIFELLQHVVNEPAPRLPEGQFAQEVDTFVNDCLEKDTSKRPTPKQLLRYTWYQDADKAKVDLEAWAGTLLP